MTRPWETVAEFALTRLAGIQVEGLLTTLDSPDEPERSLTPTQELQDARHGETQDDRGQVEESSVLSLRSLPHNPNRMNTRARNAKRGLARRRVAELL